MRKCIKRYCYFQIIIGVFFALSSVGCTFFSENLHPRRIIISQNNGKPLVRTLENRPVQLGYFTHTPDEHSVYLELYNETKHEIFIQIWRSSCPCINIVSGPTSIAPGKQKLVHLIIQTEYYEGKLRKSLVVPVSWNDKIEMIYIPIEFNVEKLAQPQSEIFFVIKYIEFTSKNFDIEKFLKNNVWLFGSKGCLQCEQLKKVVFPMYFPEGSEIVIVDLDNPEGLKILLQLEQQSGILAGGNAPILYYRGDFYYGFESIQNALSTRKVKFQR